MLQSLREKATGGVAFFIIGALVISFAFWGIQDYLHGSADGVTIAKVNGNKITQQQVNKAYQRLQQQLVAQKVLTIPLSLKQQAQLKKEALNQLIEMNVFADAARSDGYRVSDQQIDATIKSMPTFQVNGQFSPARFQQILSAMLYTQAQFINDLRQSILVTQMNAGVMGSAFVLPNEIKTVSQLMHQKRDFEYLLLPTSKFAKQVTVSKQEIDDYYQKNQDQFMLPAQVSIEYIELSVKNIEKNLNLSKQELQQYYDDNIDLFSTPEKWKLATLLIRLPHSASAQQLSQAKQKASDIEAKLKQGESFDKLISEYSDNKTSRITGDSGSWVTKSDLPALLGEVVSKLSAGQLSQAVKTDRGYEIVKVIDIQQPKVVPLASVKEKVEKAAIAQKAQKQFSDDSEQLANLTYTDPSTLKSAANALNLTVHTTGLFTQKGDKTGITSNPKITSMAFSDNVLKDDNNSDPINLSPTQIVVLRIKQSEPEHDK